MRSMASNPQLDHVQIAAPPACEAEARAFYGQLLGLKELEKPASLGRRGGVWFAIGDHQLHVGVDERFTPARKAHPAFRWADDGELRAVAARLSAAGVRVDWDEHLPGVRRFFSSDPWGNRLEFLATNRSPARVKRSFESGGGDLTLGS
jgi:catechol 2,3-dioxygenase-like lactoylglutathione lyase family enzyme